MSDFDVFLCHNSNDKPALRHLAAALRARGLRAWLDEWELIPGRPRQAALEEIIATVPCTAVLVGKDGLGSQYVKRGSPVVLFDRPAEGDAIAVPGGDADAAGN